MRIRSIDAGQCDIHALYALLCDVYTTSDSMSETLEEKYPTPDALQADIAAISARPGSLLLVAEADGRLLGYIAIKPRVQSKLRHTAELNMGVHSQARGQRIGTQLLEAALSQLCTHGAIEIVYLMVRPDNLPAVRLYERAGFERLALLAHDTKIGDTYHDGLLMRMFLKDLL